MKSLQKFSIYTLWEQKLINITNKAYKQKEVTEEYSNLITNEDQLNTIDGGQSKQEYLKGRKGKSGERTKVKLNQGRMY